MIPVNANVSLVGVFGILSGVMAGLTALMAVMKKPVVSFSVRLILPVITALDAWDSWINR